MRRPRCAEAIFYRGGREAFREECASRLRIYLVDPSIHPAVANDSKGIEIHPLGHR